MTSTTPTSTTSTTSTTPTKPEPMSKSADAKEKDDSRNKTIQVDPELYAEIEKLAEAADRTISKQAGRILRQALAGQITGD